ncbi:protein phosphatase CheZ [Marinobacterium arenosum]|uniref:protein phosphatase CheZ n=1 Tax=Marinobacterium arenosum TaxID=2862496 RepID=UPI001C938330|nr:protein phosphatase CheZ [Marinobacterium arenosum]MBY4675964.1 protein phosphatase CheZ [Marinobacterium arenosum]
MTAPDLRQGIDQFESLLHSKARELVDVLEQGDLASAMVLIQELNEAKHRAFYNEVGFLTRGLHEAIKAFSSDVGNAIDGKSKAEGAGQVFADASERLAYVIEVTESNAHDTMDRIDTALTLVDRLDKQSERFKDLLSLVGQLEGEFEGLRGVYDRTCTLKEESEQTIETLRGQLTDILVSQSYQDITGQLIRRVITLVTNVEGHLVKLMEMAAQVERLSGIDVAEVLSSRAEPNENKTASVQAEGPQIKKDAPDVACDQDDVDELLSSLGF